MATTTVEKEVLDLEKQYWHAIKNEDLETALKLTDDPCIVAGASGVASIDRKSFEAMMKGAKYKLRAFDIKDVKFRLLTDDVAVIAYKVHEDLTVDGQPVSMDAADTSTWIRRDGYWRCALHTEARASDS
jgi:hypothetical protein